MQQNQLNVHLNDRTATENDSSRFVSNFGNLKTKTLKVMTELTLEIFLGL